MRIGNPVLAEGLSTVADAAARASGSAAATGNGQIIGADVRFTRWLHEEELSGRLATGAGDTSWPQILIVAGKGTGRPIAVAAMRAALARIVSEVDAPARLAEACDVNLTMAESAAEPLRLLKRRDRPGRIGFADFGPPAEDPHERDALVRSGRQSGYGRDGFVAEQLLLSRGASLPVLAGGARYNVVSGASDQLFDAGDSADYWRGILPGCGYHVVADGGRYLHITHGVHMVAALGPGN